MQKKDLKINKYLPIGLVGVIGDKMLETDNYVERAYIRNVLLLAFATNFEIEGKKKEAVVDYITEHYDELEEKGYFIGFSSIDNFYMINEYVDYKTNIVYKFSKVLDMSIPLISEIEKKIKKLSDKDIINLINNITKK